MTSDRVSYFAVCNRLSLSFTYIKQLLGLPAALWLVSYMDQYEV